MNAATIKLLIAKGMTAEDIAEIAEALEARAGKADRTNAERQARYRERKRNAVTVTPVTPPNDIYSNPPGSSDDEPTPAPKAKTGKPTKPDDVSSEVWSDFVALRRSQKAPPSETAVKAIRREAEKAGWTLETALSETVSRGWRGFKADWVQQTRAVPMRGEPSSFLDHLLSKQGSGP